MNATATTTLTLVALIIPSFCLAQSGDQTIHGTRVHTEVFQAEGFARFSNECGSQTLTQRELQAGAIPDEIIPCPRPEASDGNNSHSNQGSGAAPKSKYEMALAKAESQIAVWLNSAASETNSGLLHMRREEWSAASTDFIASSDQYNKARMALLNVQSDYVLNDLFDKIDELTKAPDCLFKLSDSIGKIELGYYYNFVVDALQCGKLSEDSNILNYARLLKARFDRIGPVVKMPGTNSINCPSGYFRGSRGYGSGWTCMPYGAGPVPNNPSMTPMHQSGISGIYDGGPRDDTRPRLTPPQN